MRRLQPLIVVCVVLGVSLLGWRVLRRALASDQQKVQWVFEEVREGFNSTRLASVMGGFGEGYRDESTGLSRAELRDVVIYLFFNEKDPDTKRFSLRMDVDPESLIVEVSDGTRARVRGAARFYQTQKSVERVFWDATFVAELAQTGGDWHIVHTSEVNVADLEDLD